MLSFQLTSSSFFFCFFFFVFILPISLCIVNFPGAMNLSLVFIINSISLVDIAWTRPPFEEHKLLSRNLQILSTLLARDDGMIGSLNQCGTVGVMSHTSLSFVSFSVIARLTQLHGAPSETSGNLCTYKLMPDRYFIWGSLPWWYIHKNLFNS